MTDKNTKGILKKVTEAVYRCIPFSSLPMSYHDHEDLACELVIELSASVCLVDKDEFDKMLKRLRQLRRYEQAIIDGMLYSPLADLSVYVIPDPFKLD